MIMGEYPCCGGTLALVMGERSGYAPHDCEHCGAKVWTRFSRLNPETWTDADFRRTFEVDEVAKKITRRPENGEWLHSLTK